MVIALIYWVSSVVILVFLTAVYVVEDARGERIFLASAREQLDSLCRLVSLKVSYYSASFSHGFMRVLLHYSVHSVLSQILLTLQKLEKKLENLVRHNRKVAKDIHAIKTKGHLDAIARHQKETALSDTQKKEMRSH